MLEYLDITRLVIIAAAGIVVMLLLTGGQRGRWLLFCVAVASTGVGYRSIHLGQWSLLVPVEVILWLLWGSTLLSPIRTHTPLTMYLLVIWAILRASWSMFTTSNWDSPLAWTLPLIVCIPAFQVTAIFVKGLGEARTVLKIVAWVSFVVALLGILEYLFPSVESRFPQLFGSTAGVTQEGFRRAAFSFFGYTAAPIIAWGTVITYNFLFYVRGTLTRIAMAGILFVDLYAIVISGQRSTWFALAAALVVIGVKHRARGQLVNVLIASGLAVYGSFMFVRAMTVISLIQTGKTSDTSNLSRISLWEFGWSQLIQNPVFGAGYGLKLAHNGVLEVGKALGAIPAFIMIILLVQILWKVALPLFAERSIIAPDIYWSVLGITIVVYMQVLVETVLATPAFAAAHWLMLAMAWHLPAILNVRLQSQYEVRAIRLRQRLKEMFQPQRVDFSS